MTAPVSGLAPVSFNSYFDTGVGTVKQCALYFYRAGTLDPITVYTDALLAIPHPVPVLTTGWGQVPPVWVGVQPDPNTYRVRVFDQYSQLVQDVDNLPGPFTPTYTPPPTADPTALLVTGDVIPSFSNSTPRPGAVRCNGNTIGNTGSGGSERANADCHALFVWLWGQDLYGALPITPSRGATAEGDWSSNKQIAVPDLRARVICGMDGMGSSITNRLAGAALPNLSTEKVGASFGVAQIALTEAMLPSHTHGLTDFGHVHGVTVPAHAHTASGFSDNIGGHAHNLTIGNETAQHTHTVVCGGSTVALPVGSPSGTVVPTTAPSTTGGENVTHQHTGFTDNQGTHQHTLTITVNQQPAMTASVTSATTGLTVSQTGGNGYHALVQPTITLCFFMKL